MPRYLFGAAVLGALFAAAPALAQEQPRVVATFSIPAEPPSEGTPTHELRLALYTFQGTRWLVAEIVVAMREAMRLVSHCGVTLTGAELKVLDAARRFHFYSVPVSRELLLGMSVPRPAIFFVEDTRNHPAFDAEAIGRSNSATRPELRDTIWVAHGARDLSHALAHELVHLLSDSGEHSTEPGNLMQAETSPANTHLMHAQCERLRTQGEASGLLKPIARGSLPPH